LNNFRLTLFVENKKEKTENEKEINKRPSISKQSALLKTKHNIHTSELLRVSKMG